ncbi:hypothetical protein L4X63_16845 [Geomonas sp. Red32]|nr:hypothetical protein [Geomonas sp. Red32]MCM0083255.1 hypothetical protein [Geomonas sp. Red32]
MLRSAGFLITGHSGDEIYLCEPHPDSPSCIATWNREEYLSAAHVTEPE